MEADISRLGKYEIISILGKGAMGVVYKGFDPAIERHVAIKTVRKDLIGDDPDDQMELARFKREAQAAGRLTHPNIVAIYEYGEQDGTAYIAMEYVEGKSLKDYFDAQERFDIKAVVDIMSGVLAALDYSHAQGVIHRDIKPANIMITKNGEVKITDFGVARIETSTMTQAGAVLGTPSYMSPEQFMGQTVDKRSDIFSAGAVLYQFLTGEKPFTGSVTTIMHKVLNTMPPRPSDLNVACPRSFDPVVEKAMAKRPDDRYQTARLFAEGIREAYDNRNAASGDPDATLAAGEATIASGLSADVTMVAAPAPARAPAEAKPADAAGAAPASVKRGGSGGAMVIGGGLAAVVAVGVGAWFVIGGKPEQPSPAPVAPRVEASVPAAPAPVPPTPATPAPRPAAVAAPAPAPEPVKAPAAPPAPPPAAASPALPPPAVVQPPRMETAVLPKPPAPATAPVTLSVVTDRGAQPVYKAQEKAVIQVAPSQTAYVYCYYRDAAGDVYRMFPNRFAQDSRVQGGGVLRIPDQRMPFDIQFLKSGATEAITCLAARRDILEMLNNSLGAADLTEPLRVRTLDEVVRAARAITNGDVGDATLTMKVE